MNTRRNRTPAQRAYLHTASRLDFKRRGRPPAERAEPFGRHWVQQNLFGTAIKTVPSELRRLIDEAVAAR